MKVLQTIIVKQVLTEESKERIHQKYHSRKLQLQKEWDQLRFELKKLEKSRKFPPETLKKHFEQEIKVYKEKIKLLDFQIEQLHILPLGSEIKETELQGVVDVSVGDQWMSFFQERLLL